MQPPQMPMQPPQMPMQQSQMPQASGGLMASLQYGLIFGGIIGLLDFLYSYLLSVTNPLFLTSLSNSLLSLPPTLFDIIYPLILSIPIYILLFICFLLAGLFAARKTRRVISGLLAGLFVGGIYLLIDLLFANLLLLYLVTFPMLASQVSPTDLASLERSLLTSSLAYSVVAGLILLGIGVLIGSLGGVIGKGGSTQPLQYQPYVSNPYQVPPPLYPNPGPYGQSEQAQQPGPAQQPGQWPPYSPGSD